MVLLRIGRLSVQPVEEAEYRRIVAMGHVEPAPLPVRTKVARQAKAAKTVKAKATPKTKSPSRSTSKSKAGSKAKRASKR